LVDRALRALAHSTTVLPATVALPWMWNARGPGGRSSAAFTFSTPEGAVGGFTPAGMVSVPLNPFAPTTLTSMGPVYPERVAKRGIATVPPGATFQRSMLTSRLNPGSYGVTVSRYTSSGPPHE